MMPMTAAAHGCTKAHGAVMATRPASMPLAIMPGVGLAGPHHDPEHADRRRRRRRRWRCSSRPTANCTSVAAKRRRGVEAEPAEQQDERAEHGHRDVVAGQRPGLAVRAVLADAGTEHDGAGQRGHAAHGVHDAGAGEVDVAEAEVEVVAELAQPAAAPGPRAEERVVDGAAEQAPDRRTTSTSTARPSSRSGWWPRCP